MAIKNPLVKEPTIFFIPTKNGGRNGVMKFSFFFLFLEDSFGFNSDLSGSGDVFFFCGGKDLSG